MTRSPKGKSTHETIISLSVFMNARQKELSAMTFKKALAVVQKEFKDVSSYTIRRVAKELKIQFKRVPRSDVGRSRGKTHHSRAVARILFEFLEKFDKGEEPGDEWFAEAFKELAPIARKNKPDNEEADA